MSNTRKTILLVEDEAALIGAGVFFAGFAINQHADAVLMSLRKPGETGYKIPQGGCYRWVSCPNYFGEILEWTGFAIMTWSLPGLVYALWVGLPLFIQGRIAHQWYLEKFGADYPKERRAVIPFLV